MSLQMAQKLLFDKKGGCDTIDFKVERKKFWY